MFLVLVVGNAGGGLFLPLSGRFVFLLFAKTRENSDFVMDINEINVELSDNFQRYINECCESESDGKIDGFSAGCCKRRGGVAVAVWSHRECIVETDTSDFGLGGTLSQTANHKKLHPNAFYSRTFSPAEINYEIHDKDLLAIVDCFKAWRRYLEGSLHMVQVFTDHQNLEYFMTTKVLKRRQACWAQELAGVDFKIFYRKGTSNGKPDALSRCPEYRPDKGGGGDQPIQTILNEKHFGTISAISTGGEGIVFSCSAVQLAYLSTSVSKWMKEFEQEIRQEGKEDAAY
jgi:hypothetical protein